MFRPGQIVKSIVDVPTDHSPGTYWYHVHLHGLTEEQVMGGMSGLLVVDGLKRLLPRKLRDIREQQLAIRDVQHAAVTRSSWTPPKSTSRSRARAWSTGCCARA